MKYNKSYYHNEIELIRVENAELKNKIERAFLRNRISYFIRWDKVSFLQTIFGRKENQNCRICINEWDKEKAIEILKEIEGAVSGQGELLLKKTDFSISDIYVHKQQ